MQKWRQTARTWPRGVVPLALAAMLAGILLGACAPAEDGLSVDNRAPAFELPSPSGDNIALSDYKGRPVLLFFHMAVG